MEKQQEPVIAGERLMAARSLRMALLPSLGVLVEFSVSALFLAQGKKEGWLFFVIGLLLLPGIRVRWRVYLLIRSGVVAYIDTSQEPRVPTVLSKLIVSVMALFVLAATTISAAIFLLPVSPLFLRLVLIVANILLWCLTVHFWRRAQEEQSVKDRINS